MRARHEGERSGREPGRRRAVRSPLPPLDLPAPGVGLPSVAELARISAGPGLAAVVATLTADEAVFTAWAAASIGDVVDPTPVGLPGVVRADARVTLLQAAARVAAWAAGMEA